MRKNLKNILLGGVAATLVTVALGAEEGGGGVLREADLDGDGILQRAEATTKATSRFNELDKNGDDMLSLGELPKQMPGADRSKERAEKMKARHEAMQAMTPDERREAMRKRMKDKGMSNAEIEDHMARMAEHREQMKAKHARMKQKMAENTEKSEAYKVRKQERSQRHHSRMSFIGRLDADGDEMVSKDEFMAHVMHKFDRADADGDGQITAEERRGRFRNKMRWHHRMKMNSGGDQG